MSPARKVSAAAAALIVALGLGAVIQAGSAGTIQDAAEPLAMTEAPAVSLTASGTPQAMGEADQSDYLNPAVFRPASDTRPAKPFVPEAPCVIQSSAKPEPGALVRLRVSAICLPDSPVTVHHTGMTFTELTDAHGLPGSRFPWQRRMCPTCRSTIVSSCNGGATRDLICAHPAT